MNKKVVAELHKIAESNGGQLRPADVVAAARPKSSPLHSKFEWDDSEAAQRYRLWQARQLISVTVQYIGAEENPQLQRVFVSLTPDRYEDNGYTSIHAVMLDPSRRAQLLEDAVNEMRRFQKKFKDLNELAGVFSAMDSVVSKSKRTKSRQAQVDMVPA